MRAGDALFGDLQEKNHIRAKLCSINNNRFRWAHIKRTEFFKIYFLITCMHVCGYVSVALVEYGQERVSWSWSDRWLRAVHGAENQTHGSVLSEQYDS